MKEDMMENGELNGLIHINTDINLHHIILYLISISKNKLIDKIAPYISNKKYEIQKINLNKLKMQKQQWEFLLQNKKSELKTSLGKEHQQLIKII